MALKENYKDDILDTSQNVKRKYQMENNGDGTVSFTDVTEYTQQGDSFGSSDLNAMAHAINNISSDAEHTSYDNTESGLISDNVQGAIDEINDNLIVDLSDSSITSGTSFNAIMKLLVDKVYPQRVSIIDNGVFNSSVATVGSTYSLTANTGYSTLTRNGNDATNGVVFVQDRAFSKLVIKYRNKTSTSNIQYKLGSGNTIQGTADTNIHTIEQILPAYTTDMTIYIGIGGGSGTSVELYDVYME